MTRNSCWRNLYPLFWTPSWIPLWTPIYIDSKRSSPFISVAFNYKGIKCNEMPFSEQKPPDIIEWNITQLENNCKWSLTIHSTHCVGKCAQPTVPVRGKIRLQNKMAEIEKTALFNSKICCYQYFTTLWSRYTNTNIWFHIFHGLIRHCCVKLRI